MKINTQTKSGLGQFNRYLRKYNQASRNMKISHSGMYSREHCQMKRWNKWNNARKKLEKRFSFE